jgi:hypothetical protein
LISVGSRELFPDRGHIAGIASAFARTVRGHATSHRSARAESGHTDDQELRVTAVQFVVPEVQGIHHSRPKALDQNVCAGDKVP